jgi:hypothetical protein
LKLGENDLTVRIAIRHDALRVLREQIGNFYS